MSIGFRMYKQHVAADLVFEGAGPNDTIHHARLGDKNIHVSIDVVYSPDALLPVPIFHADMVTLKDAHCSHVAWPKYFVILDREENSKFCEGKCAIMAFANMLDIIMTTDTVEIPLNIFEDNLETTIVPKNELLRFCKMEELDIICVIAYMRCLYEKLESKNGGIKFINPLSALEAFFEKTLNQFITKEMRNAKENEIFFMPFNIGYHRVLIVIDYSMKVFWLDSLHGKPNLELKLFIDTGLRALVGKRRQLPTWHLIKGPRQKGTTECRFYVLKFMRELVEDSFKSITIKMEELVEKSRYENHEINELQHEFIEFIQKYMK